MAQANEAFNWQTAIGETYEEFSQQVVAHSPAILGALLLLFMGWIVATLLRGLTKRLMRGADALVSRALQRKGVDTAVTRDYSGVAGAIVYWAVLLFFAASAANMLDWGVFSDITKALVVYLPSLITGVAIIVFGFAISGFLGAAVVGAASTAGLAHSELLGRITQAAVVLTAVVIGVEQLGINVAFITNALVVSLGVSLAGVALAFALGARFLMANIIGAQAARKHLRVGQAVSVGGCEGRLIEITPTLLVLESENGRTTVPASAVLEQSTEIFSESTGVDTPFMGGLFQRNPKPDKKGGAK